jgi:hypothetical protein
MGETGWRLRRVSSDVRVAFADRSVKLPPFMTRNSVRRRLGPWLALSLAATTAAACSSTADDAPGNGTGATEPPTTAPTSSAEAPPTGLDAGADGGALGEDSDGDGISDAREAKIAADYLPFFSVHPGDKCKTHGMLYRIAPHPTESNRVMMWVIALFEKDCGANGHPGDDETFGVVIDPTKPAPDGILAVRAISHQNTPCQRITTCGSCAGMAACSTAARGGAQVPVVYASRDKHGTYSVLGTCSDLICDFGGCKLEAVPDSAPRLNAGEPTKPLVQNLTTQGFITAANGWTEASLMNFNPWKAGNFGKAGDLSKDLVDTAFVVDTTTCK